jgi:cytochrome b6-f complex iron-sulfur subunit
MDRKEFLSQLGLGGTAIFAAACMQSCSKTDNLSNTDFTLDLTSSAYAALKSPGGYIINQGVIVALTTGNTYLAVSAACPHEGVNVQFQAGQNQFYCAAHSSYFSSTGSRISGPAQRGLTQFKTTLTGNSLRVYA